MILSRGNDPPSSARGGKVLSFLLLGRGKRRGNGRKFKKNLYSSCRAVYIRKRGGREEEKLEMLF